MESSGQWAVGSGQLRRPAFAAFGHCVFSGRPLRQKLTAAGGHWTMFRDTPAPRLLNVMLRFPTIAALLSSLLIGQLLRDSAGLSALHANDVFQRQLQYIVTGGGSTTPSLPVAEEAYAKAKAAEPKEPRFPYVLALLNMKVRRYPEAIALLGETARLDRNFFPAWEAKIWIDVLHKRNDACARADGLALCKKCWDRATSESSSAADCCSERSDAARFLGGMSGYLAGPAQWPPGEDKVQCFCDSARQTLPEDLREDFLSGYTLVSGQFEQLAAGGEKAKEETIADQQQKKQSDAERLAQERRGDCGSDGIDRQGCRGKPCRAEQSGCRDRFAPCPAGRRVSATACARPGDYFANPRSGRPDRQHLFRLPRAMQGLKCPPSHVGHQPARKRQNSADRQLSRPGGFGQSR